MANKRRSSKSPVTTAIRKSLDRGFDAFVNPATKTAEVENVEAFALADFPQTAPDQVAKVITEAMGKEVRVVRTGYFAGATLSNIRKDIQKFVRGVQENDIPREEQRNGVRALMKKHGMKFVQFPSPDHEKMHVKRLQNIKISWESDTEWSRAIKLRANRIDDSKAAMKVMVDFERICAGLVNGAPTELSQI